jgi:hypothetical protein
MRPDGYEGSKETIFTASYGAPRYLNSLGFTPDKVMRDLLVQGFIRLILFRKISDILLKASSNVFFGSGAAARGVPSAPA